MITDNKSLGSEIYELAERLWPINRSITGQGVRETLSLIKAELPNLAIYEVPSGTAAFDWTVPKEWLVRDAYIKTPSGDKICEFRKNNLHVVGYSTAVDKKISLAELQSHLHSLPEQPDAIPYVTSYYEERWGFCLAHADRLNLVDGSYHVVIDSDHFDGSLTYGELIIPGTSSKEILLSTYICHPSMANNELSGPCVTTFLAKHLLKQKSLRYTYRIIYIPETIGSICYISKNLTHLKKKVFAGFNVTCVGDNRNYSYLPSRNGDTPSDKIAVHVLKHFYPSFRKYEWRDRGSDERQYCAPGVDLPIASLMRTKYGEYPEYHTSLDDLTNVVTPDGLLGGFNSLWLALEALEKNTHPRAAVICEPQLSKRGLYPSLSRKNNDIEETSLIMNFLSWSDGHHSLLEIADKCGRPIWDLYPIIELLVAHKLVNIRCYDQ
ncbi:MAG: DUF4910 domain-containing protein [Betaproteobacteria bacterium]